jgi:hypothetical protein
MLFLAAPSKLLRFVMLTYLLLMHFSTAGFHHSYFRIGSFPSVSGSQLGLMSLNSEQV